MADELQRTNNLKISNQPQIDPNWKPPTSGTIDPTWVPPDQKPVDEPSLLDRAMKPMVDVTPEMRQAMESYTKEHPVLGRLGQFGTGLLTAQSAPLSLGLEALIGGAMIPGMSEGITNALRIPGKIAGAGLGALGAYHGLDAAREMYNNPSWENAGKLASGIAEGGLGLLGLRHSIPSVLPKVESPLSIVEPQKLLGPAPEGTPRFIGGDKGIVENNLQAFDTNAPYSTQLKHGGTLTPSDIGQRIKVDPATIAKFGQQFGSPSIEYPGIQDEGGRLIAGPQPSIKERPNGPWNQNQGKSKLKFGDLEERIYKMASEKFNMGKPMNELEKKVFDHFGPDYSKDEPQFARSEKGGIKIGVNVKRSAAEVTTGYSTDLPGIMVREGLQNAIDATRHLGDAGHVTVSIDDSGKSHEITITDNGKGMTRKELETVFSDLNESGKVSEAGATGGKGIGKASYILGGAHFKVETVVTEGNKRVMRTMEGTPEDFAEHVDVKTQEVPSNTPTGTKFTTTLKENQGAYQARQMIDSIVNHTRDVPGNITPKKYGSISYKDEAVTKPFKQLKNDHVIGHTDMDGNDITLAVPKGEKLADREHIKVNYLNNGMYQFSKYHYLAGDKVSNMPEELIVNIKPSAEEGSPSYPFPTQRESVKDTLDKKIREFINEKLVNPEKNTKKQKLKELYASMIPMREGGNRSNVFYDPGTRLTPTEHAEVMNSPALNKITEVLDHAIDGILKSVNQPKWTERLEGVGLTMDPNMYGVHIPNPETGKSTILLNPFEHMMRGTPENTANETLFTTLHEVAHIGIEGGTAEPIEITELDDPRIGRYLQAYLKETKEHGGRDMGHGIGFIKRLGDIYAKYGPSKTFKASDEILSAITDNTGGYSPEVQRLLQLYKESRGREATTEDFLSGTGEQQKSPNNGKGNTKRDSGSNASRAVTKLVAAIAEAKPLREEQEQIYSAERGQRFRDVEKVKTPGLAGFYSRLGKMKGKMPRVEVNPTKLNTKDRDNLMDAIHISQRITTPEKIRAGIALLKLVEGTEVPQRNELKILSDTFGKEFDPVIEMHGGFGGKILSKPLHDVLNMPKAIMASMDVSAPLRQGLPLIHKKEFWNSLGPMFQALKSKENFNALQESLKDRPGYLLGKEAGLMLTETGKNIGSREEQYGSGLAEKIPGVAASERAYVGFLNKLRADTFDSLIEDAKRQGLHPKDVMHEIANFVNNATGRGSLDFSSSYAAKVLGNGKEGFGNLDKMATELNALFFSPRLIASRLQILNPKYYINASPFVRQEALKSLFAIASAGLTINSLLSVAGAKTDFTLSDRKGTGLIPGTNGLPGMPISADFMKSRFGNTRTDPYGGFQQYVVAAGRVLSGEEASSVTGKVSQLGKTFNSPTRLGVLGSFAENKLSPVASLVDIMLRGKDFQGNPINVPKEIADRFTPMILNDLYQIYKDDPKHLPLILGSALGTGTQTYQAKPNVKSLKLRLR